MQLSLPDFVVLFVYFGGLLVIGLVAARRQSSESVYFLGERRTSSWMAGISVLATLLSTLTYLAVPSEMIGHGIGYFYSQFAFVLIIPLVNWLMIPALMQLPVTSVYEYLERRFSVSVRMVGAAVFVLTRIIWVGLIIYSASGAIHEMTNWPIVWLMAFMGAFTAVYTTLGGLQAVIWTDFAQFLLLFGGALFVPCYVAWQTESTPAVWWQLFSEAGHDTAPVWTFDLTTRITIVGIILDTLVWNLCTHGADQVAAQRYLSTPSAAAARRSVWVFSLLSVAMIVLLMLCGLSVFFYHYAGSALTSGEIRADSTEQADKLFPRFIATELPRGVRGLIVAALLAAAMSSMSSGMNSVATVTITDFFERFSPRDRTTGYLRLAKMLSMLVGLVAIAVAVLGFELKKAAGWNILEMIQRLNHLCVAPLGALFLCGILFRRVGAAASLIGFFAGVATSGLVSFSREIFAMQNSLSFMWIMPSSFCASMFVTYLASWFLPDAPSRTHGTTHSQRGN
jgi:SSS family solute:Na+ symporter